MELLPAALQQLLYCNCSIQLVTVALIYFVSTATFSCWKMDYRSLVRAAIHNLWQMTYNSILNLVRTMSRYVAAAHRSTARILQSTAGMQLFELTAAKCDWSTLICWFTVSKCGWSPFIGGLAVSKSGWSLIGSLSKLCFFSYVFFLAKPMPYIAPRLSWKIASDFIHNCQSCTNLQPRKEFVCWYSYNVTGQDWQQCISYPFITYNWI